MANSIRTGEVIDTWLPNQQREVISKLSSNSELQLKYLQDFLKERENEIRDIIMSAGKRSKTNSEVQDYRNFLALHVKLLAEQDSPELKTVVMKDYYPMDSLDEVEDDSLIIKEAKAYLKKRSEMYADSLRIFLHLMEQLSYDNIKLELFGAKAFDKTNNLSFNKLYDEVCEILVKSTGRPDCTEVVWFDALKTLFRIKDKHSHDKKGTKAKPVLVELNKKLSNFLLLMSKYVDFQAVIDTLVETDKDAKFSYAHEWLKTIIRSKSDQEFLYRSAKGLLKNENSAMIDTIVQQHENGLKGSIFYKCALCNQLLGAMYKNSECRFCM